MGADVRTGGGGQRSVAYAAALDGDRRFVTGGVSPRSSEGPVVRKLTLLLLSFASLLAAVAFAGNKAGAAAAAVRQMEHRRRPARRLICSAWTAAGSRSIGATRRSRAGRETDAYLGVVREQANGAGHVWFVRITAIANTRCAPRSRRLGCVERARRNLGAQAATPRCSRGCSPASAATATRSRVRRVRLRRKLPGAVQVAPSYPEDASSQASTARSSCRR